MLPSTAAAHHVKLAEDARKQAEEYQELQQRVVKERAIAKEAAAIMQASKAKRSKGGGSWRKGGTGSKPQARKNGAIGSKRSLSTRRGRAANKAESRRPKRWR
jgi:hypothetical protein